MEKVVVVLDGRSIYGATDEARYIEYFKSGIGVMAHEICMIASAYHDPERGIDGFEAIGISREAVERIGNGEVFNIDGRRFFFKPRK